MGQDGSDERVHVFTGTLNTGLRYYLRRLAAKERFVLERFDPDTPARIRAIMKEERIYLVRNLFWLGPYESTFQEFERDQGVDLSAVLELTGLELFTLTVQE